MQTFENYLTKANIFCVGDFGQRGDSRQDDLRVGLGIKFWRKQQGICWGK